MAITDTRTGWAPRTLRAVDVDANFADMRRSNPDDAGDPLADEPKWPAWKVTVAVVVFCGAFWAGIIYLAMRLLG